MARARVKIKTFLLPQEDALSIQQKTMVLVLTGFKRPDKLEFGCSTLF